MKCDSKFTIPYWDNAALKPVDSNLLLWFQADYGTPASWQDLTGKYVGTPTVTTQRAPVDGAGTFGQAWQFNGIDTAISVPEDGMLGGMSALTVDTWVYYVPGGTKASSRIVDKWKTSGGLYQLFRSTNTVAPIVGESIGGYLRGYDASINPATGLPYGDVPIAGTMNTTILFDFNKWQQVSMVYDGITVIFYKNGSEIYRKTATKPNLPITTSTDPLYIGALRTTNNNFLGTVGEVRIYDRALLASEIYHNYVHSPFYYIQRVI